MLHTSTNKTESISLLQNSQFPRGVLLFGARGKGHLLPLKTSILSYAYLVAVYLFYNSDTVL
jgi:hypothetical protein